ncbi:Lys-gingipain W83 precursor [Weeksella virosa]|uniref:T9SS-dependent choice-of-anchor J family protein n=1 Tax=Weeksella virosa TaxID=1014 RepID=UPI000E0518F4|nr:choice-of-anchor J domain-containing protein [Weeksella virosa]SUP54332.1 Lys-gingipain W83 precursor [Weeksella virosa]
MIKNLLILGAIALGSYSAAQTVIFNENFDAKETQNLWTIGDLDGDSDTWEFMNAEQSELPNFTGEVPLSFSWYFVAFTPDNTLTSPAIQLPESGELTLSFKVAAGDKEVFEEHYAVYVIPAGTTFTGTETAIFEETLDAGYVDAAKVVNVDISEFVGQNIQLVFRHYQTTDVFYIGIDDVKIEQATMGIDSTTKTNVNVYPNPTVGLVQLSGNHKVIKVRVFDLSGRKVSEANASSASLKHLSNGVYLVNFYTDNNEVYTRKVVKK